MRVHIPGFWPNTSEGSGKALFCARLHRALEQLPGVELVRDRKQADIQLHLIRMHNKYRGCKNVLRLNGIYHDSRLPCNRKNRPMRDAIRACDAVVYQSKFSQEMCDRYLGATDKPRRVILNGADPCDYEDVSPPAVDCDAPFLTFARWRPHKRLRDTIEAFLDADIAGAKLFVAGDLSNSGLSDIDVTRYSREYGICFLGQQTQQQLRGYLSVARGVIHLNPFDWCPNAVVEAVCADVPVVCSNSGGTREIVGPACGHVCDIDPVYDGEPIDLRHLCPVDRSVVAAGIRKCMKPRQYYCGHVDIQSIATSYCNFFREVLS